MTPEERARQKIDLLLQQSGWIVQDRSQINLAAGPGVAIREALLKTGEADYLLFAGGKAIATVEAKPEGYTRNTLRCGYWIVLFGQVDTICSKLGAL
jgi:type I restriction enzyme R subunit